MEGKENVGLSNSKEKGVFCLQTKFLDCSQCVHTQMWGTDCAARGLMGTDVVFRLNASCLIVHMQAPNQ